MEAVPIRPLVTSTYIVESLAALLVETVAHGGSVSFMDPLSHDKATAFWEASLASAARGERVIFGAFAKEDFVGTITLVTSLPENQPHRAEIAKMMVSVPHRGRGIASALLRAVEAQAVALGRTHLTLDTASDGGAAGLYERHGFLFAGEIPDYALKPHGGLTGTRLYWKRIG